VGDAGGADLPLPIFACSVADAQEQIRRSYQADDTKVRSIEASSYGLRHVLLIVHFDDEECAPALLLFTPQEEDLAEVQARLRKDGQDLERALRHAQALETVGGIGRIEAVLEAAHSALDDASGVVDAGDDEDHAYSKELTDVADLLAVVRDEAKHIDKPRPAITNAQHKALVKELRRLRREGLCFADCVEVFGSRKSGNRYVHAADRNYGKEGSIEIDDEAVVSKSDEGAYVMGWLWVGKHDL
jgi:hypothetical protein